MQAATPALDVAAALWSCGSSATVGELPLGLLPQGCNTPQLQPFSCWQAPPKAWAWGGAPSPAPPPLAHTPAYAAAAPYGCQLHSVQPHTSGTCASAALPAGTCLLHPGAAPQGSWQCPPPAAPAPAVFVPAAEAGGYGCPSCSAPTNCRCCGRAALVSDSASSGALGTPGGSAVCTAVGSAVPAGPPAGSPDGQAAVEVAARLLRTGGGSGIADGMAGPDDEATALPGSMDWALLAEELLGPCSTPPPPGLPTGPLAFTGGGRAVTPQLPPMTPGSGDLALPRGDSSVHLAACFVSPPGQVPLCYLGSPGGASACVGDSSSGSLGSLTGTPAPGAAPSCGAPPAATTAVHAPPPADGGGVPTEHEPPHLHKTSQFRGVSWCKRRCMWESAISIAGKRERLGFYQQEDAAARAYDRAAAWRNAEAHRQLAASVGKRRRGGDDAGGAGAGAAAPPDATGAPGKRRQLAVLPLNLPDEAPAPAELGESSLPELLSHIRDAAKSLLKAPQQPALAAAGPRPAAAAAPPLAAFSPETAAAAAVPASPDGTATVMALFDPARPSSSAGAVAVAAAAASEEGQEEPATDPGLAAAAALRQARQGGASLRAAAAAAGAAAAAVLHPSPLAKSSRYQGVCQCGPNRWQAQVTHKRHRHYLGMHEREEEAAAAYDQGAICLLGAAARTNFPLDRYDVTALHALSIEQVAARLKARSRAGPASASGGGGGRKRRRASLAEEAEEDA